jgi:flagellar motility protein MotE (MotC chaperone)
VTEATTERAIGRLEGKLDAVARAVEETRAAGDAGRSRIYGELEEIRSGGAESRRDIADSRKKIDEINEKMKQAEQTLSEIKRWKERGIGMGMAFGLLGFSVAAFAQLIWKWVAAKIGM